MEAALRNSNYRVADSQHGNPILEGLFCECGSAGCEERLSVEVEDYDRVRSMDRRFFVAPGHNFPGAEEIVEERPGWVIVEKPEEVASTLKRIDDPSDL